MDLHYSQTRSIWQNANGCFTTLWIYTILKPGSKLDYAFIVSLAYGFTLFSNADKSERNFSQVSLPYGFTLFSNQNTVTSSSQSVSLPYGFTLFSNLIIVETGKMCVSLPYGFTLFSNSVASLISVLYVSLPYGFTLFSNQALTFDLGCLVSLPYGFTLFSNHEHGINYGLFVSLPYGFTLFSNERYASVQISLVSLPYGFTLFSNFVVIYYAVFTFHYLMDLHYSQTWLWRANNQRGFTTLWIYTILKRNSVFLCFCTSFTTLWIYTILKPSRGVHTEARFVSLPYGFTLFSNPNYRYCNWQEFHYLMDLHYSQTSNKLRPLYSAGQIHKI